MKIKPMPTNIGYGFTLDSKKDYPGYTYEQTDMFHNYHFTLENYEWPVPVSYFPREYIMDGFSPNLNKKLHVGHLRNFCMALAIQNITKIDTLAMLGTTLGLDRNEYLAFLDLCVEHGYNPMVFFDTDLGAPPNIVFEKHPDGHETYGSVVVVRSDGRPTYAYHDIALAYWCGPDYYITGCEQKDHFNSLGLGDKHLPMGLVLGTDGKKIKSRSGEALGFQEALELIESNLKATDNSKDIAWNIAAFNMLSSGRATNVKFILEQWVNPSMGGMYVTYTYARLAKALNSCGDSSQIKEEHLPLLGMCSYLQYYHQDAINKMDPCPLATYTLKLAKALNKAYESGPDIQGADPGYAFVISKCVDTLEKCMKMLGMKIVEKV